MSETNVIDLPGLDCGLCGYRTCGELKTRLDVQPQLIKRCIHVSANVISPEEPLAAAPVVSAPCAPCAVERNPSRIPGAERKWKDNLGRDFDFYLEKFPEEVGPREIIIPHNPMLTREMELTSGDVLIGRPLGMSCGCPVTHCGIVQDVDRRTGVLTWCVTGPLGPRKSGFKDIGYYIAEGYEGLIKEAACDIRIGMRYFFQPRMCMLQWRHSGLVNYVNAIPEGLQVRVEGLWIG